MAFQAGDPAEWLSNGRSFDHGGKIYFSTGDTLYSNLSRPMFTQRRSATAAVHSRSPTRSSTADRVGTALEHASSVTNHDRQLGAKIAFDVLRAAVERDLHPPLAVTLGSPAAPG